MRASSASPISWWLLALGFAIFAGSSANILVQLAVCGVSLILILLLREPAPWSQSVRFYLFLATFVVLARLLFRIVFNIPNPLSPTIISLPAVVVDLGFGSKIQLLGPISESALIAGATDGFRLAAIILSVAMAASLANPRRLLKSTPAALYEIASSISVAINLAPQLIASLQRVQKARMLRGRSKRLGALASTIIPVLEDAIESSLALAASMDARGFGSRGNLTASRLGLARVGSLAAILGLSVGSFLLLTGAALGIGFGVIIAGIFCGAVSLKIYSGLSVRTRYNPESFQILDYLIFTLSIVLVVLAIARIA